MAKFKIKIYRKYFGSHLPLMMEALFSPLTIQTVIFFIFVVTIRHQEEVSSNLGFQQIPNIFSLERESEAIPPNQTTSRLVFANLAKDLVLVIS